MTDKQKPDIMEKENKSILGTLKFKSKQLSQLEIQQDFNYFQAQKVITQMLECGLISLSEFNKLSQLNRETFSPLLVEIMPKIS